MSEGEEWISQAEYCRRYKMNTNTFKQLAASGEIEVRKLDSGYYKVKVGSKDMVSREIYDKVVEEKITLETKLNNILLIVKGDNK